GGERLRNPPPRRRRPAGGPLGSPGLLARPSPGPRPLPQARYHLLDPLQPRRSPHGSPGHFETITITACLQPLDSPSTRRFSSIAPKTLVGLVFRPSTSPRTATTRHPPQRPERRLHPEDGPDERY